MFSVITNIYNKKTKGPTLTELFVATGKLKKFFFLNYSKHRYNIQVPAIHVNMGALIFFTAAMKNIDAPALTRVWQELEYHIDVCRVTRGAPIEHL
jgi:hypothetical protein